jgi:nitrite reductase/ring-hydroxylating ferredoxin subunit
MEKVCKVSDIAEGAMKGFTVKNQKILLANIGGKFYCMDAVCSHMKGYLPDGTLKGKVVVCPIHHAQYDVTNGKLVKNVSFVTKMATGRGAHDMKTFKTIIKQDAVYVDI